MKAITTMTKRITSMVLCLAMVLTMLPAIGQKTTAATISNPRIVADSSMWAGQKVQKHNICKGKGQDTKIMLIVYDKYGIFYVEL